MKKTAKTAFAASKRRADQSAPTFMQAQRGNTFLVILLAVALFAGLSFTVIRSMRLENTSRMSARDAQLAATDIIGFGQKVERTVDRLRRKGCSENQISFKSNVGGYREGDIYDNPNSPSDSSCELFSPAGGNLSGPNQFPAQYFAYSSCQFNGDCLQIYTGHHFKWYLRRPEFGGRQAVGDIGTDAAELYLLIGDLKEEICVKINDILGVPNPSGRPTGNYGTIYSNSRGFAGNYATGAGMGVSGHPQGCVSDGSLPDNSNGFFYYHVLIER